MYFAKYYYQTNVVFAPSVPVVPTFNMLVIKDEVVPPKLLLAVSKI